MIFNQRIRIHIGAKVNFGAVGEESLPRPSFCVEPGGGALDADVCGGSVMIIMEIDPKDCVKTNNR
jgi:hypothetical protein